MDDLRPRRGAVERTRSQLPLAGDSPEPGAVQGSPDDDPIAALERVSKDLSSALTLLRKLRNLAKDPTANAVRIRTLLSRTKPTLAKLPVEITTKVEESREMLGRMATLR